MRTMRRVYREKNIEVPSSSSSFSTAAQPTTSYPINHISLFLLSSSSSSSPFLLHIPTQPPPTHPPTYSSASLTSVPTALYVHV